MSEVSEILGATPTRCSVPWSECVPDFVCLATTHGEICSI